MATDPAMSTGGNPNQTPTHKRKFPINKKIRQPENDL